MTVALRRTDHAMSDPVEPVEPVTDESLARMAAEKLRPQILGLGLNDGQVEAVLDAVHFALIDQKDKAKAALQTKLSESSVEEIYPAIIESLSSAA